MPNYADLIAAIAELAPPVIALLAIVAAFVAAMVALYRVGVPALSTLTKMFADQTAAAEALRQGWQDLVEKNEIVAQRMLAELRRELANSALERQRLEERIVILETALCEKDKEIAELRTLLAASDKKLEASDKKLTAIQQELAGMRIERDAIKAERDELKERLEAIEGKTAPTTTKDTTDACN